MCRSIFTYILLVLGFLLTTNAQAKDVPVEINDRVEYWIKVFQKNKESYFNSWLLKSKEKLPKMKALLKKHELPTDLAYLSIIESGLNPKAVSSAKAVGYWQFMEPTAVSFGLKVDWWIDERHDLIKSTWAAARYLKKLYGMFGNWYLSLSAYNMGENRLKRLIRRHKSKDFWTLSQKRGFPSETREYVPKFLAAALIVKNPSFYGFQDPEKPKSMKYSYQYVPGGTDLLDLSQKFDISSEALKKLNPELKRYYIPKNVTSHRIRVPQDFRKKVSLYLSKNSDTLQKL